MAEAATLSAVKMMGGVRSTVNCWGATTMAEAATLSVMIRVGGALSMVDGRCGDAVSGDKDGRRAASGR